MKILTFLLVLMISVSLQDRLCTDQNNAGACTNIEREGTYQCESVNSKISCILNIDKGEHQFAVVDAEQALLAASFASDNVVVVGEVGAEKPPYQTVVVVRNKYNTTDSLRGSQFCHPGFKHDELVTRFVLSEFENKIIDANKTYCDIKGVPTLLEKELSVLSNFFGRACRPGPWVYDNDDLDKKLKSKYSNLCDFCGTQKCDVSYKSPFNDSLECLSNGGDVAVTGLYDALIFLNKSDNANRYQFLCPNGTVSGSQSPCVWTRQLNRLIVTERTVADKPKIYIQKYLPGNVAGFSSQSLGLVNVEEAIQSLLKVDKTHRISFLTTPVPLKTYVAGIRQIPSTSNSSRCKEEVNWCTLTNEEQKKCMWLSQAALNTGLEPALKCVMSQDVDTVSCLNDLQNDKADIMYADITYGYIALKKGLVPIAYPETTLQNISYVVIVVKNDTTIKSLADLKGKQSCFPQYGGREWLAFIDTLRTKNLAKKPSCDYSAIFNDFVGSSCVPDAHQSKDFEFITGDNKKLCEQCIPVSSTSTAAYCNADENNKYYGTDGALRCLSSGAGEYAVITIKDIREFRDSSNAFRILATNGSVLTTQNWFISNLEEVALAAITSGEVIVKNTNTKKEDIKLLLNGIEVEFGQLLNKPFEVYDIFNGTSNLLFPDYTPGLDIEGSGTINKYVDNFKALLKRSEDCMTNPNSASSIISSTILLAVTILIVRF